MKVLDCLAFLLIFVGAVNWGWIGAFDFNFVEEICDAIVGEKEVETTVVEDLAAPEDVVEEADLVVAETEAVEVQDEMSLLERIIYIVVGVAGVFALVRCIMKCCCKKKECSPAPAG